MFMHQSKLSLAGGILGTNVGVYQFSKDSPSGRSISDAVLGGILGAGVGYGFGYTTPVLFPLLATCIPGYCLARYHSSLLESKQKEERLKALKDLSSKTKEVLRG